jgi:glycosyltransferase involved in cell wall biosynthesis
MRWGCPVAASDIPALREAFASMEDAMVFFDPRSASAIADAIAGIITDRDAVRVRQTAAFEWLRARTWADVAQEWVAVCDEAIRRHRE